MYTYLCTQGFSLCLHRENIGGEAQYYLWLLTFAGGPWNLHPEDSWRLLYWMFSELELVFLFFDDCFCEVTLELTSYISMYALSQIKGNVGFF